MKKKFLQNIEQNEKEYEKSVIEIYNNYKWMLYIGMGGLLLLFFDLTFMLAMSKKYYNETPLKLPLIFYWNTIFLVLFQ